MFINGMNRFKFEKAGDEGAGAPPANPDTPDQGDKGNNSDDVVTMSRADYERFKADMHKHKEGYRSATQELEEQRLKDMEAKEQHKEVADYHKNRAEKFEQQNKELVSAIEYDKKLSEVQRFAQQAGMNKQALNDLEVFASEIQSQVVVEKTDMGRMNVHGAQEYVEALKAKRPYLFTGKGTNINPSTGGIQSASSTNLSTDDVVKARNKWKKSGSKTDEKAYYDTFEKYRQQQAQA